MNYPISTIRPTIPENESLTSRSYNSNIGLDYIYERLFNKNSICLSLGTYQNNVIKEFNIKNWELIHHHIFRDIDEDGDSLESLIFNKNNDIRNFYLFFHKEKSLIAKITEQKHTNIHLAGQNLKELENFTKTFQKYKIISDNTEIGILCCEGGNPYVKDIKTTRVNLDIGLNYGEKFIPIHDKVLLNLKSKKNGAYLFHGISGSGKTTYIKYLAQNSGRKFIFIPTNQIDSLSSPSLIPTLLDNQNSVLILEDAEKAITAREENENASLVSTILNLTDGILSSMLNVALIITFNTGKEKVDSALIRKGRLIVEHQFNPLSIQDSQKLVDSLNKKYKVTKEMSLADIYYLEEDNYHLKEPEKIIGFI